MTDLLGLIKDASYINGTWHREGSLFDVSNKATGEVIAKVHDAGADEVKLAITSANQALPSWSALPAGERADILKRWYALMMESQDKLGQLLTLEQGKPLAEAKGEIAYGAKFIEWFAEEARRVYGDTIPAPSGDKRIIVTKQPVGVVAAITPWNFPNAMIARKAAAALAAGCTFVVRPAELTPLSALAMADLAEQAGVPKGVFNVVVGTDAAEMGKAMTQSSIVRKFSFTGSTRVGKLLIADCASTIKRVSMELGGNAPFIVFDDADLDAAIEGALASKYRNAGQTCVCTNRFIVQAGIYDAFVDKLSARVKQMKVGNGLDEGVSIGPMISEQAAASVAQMVSESVAQGATLICGGDTADAGKQFLNPAVMTNVSNTMPIASNEIFGPVSPVIRFTTEEEAISIANDTDAGLAAYFYTKDLGRTWRVADALDYGMVGVNEGIISNPVAPFGGMKQSGYGREGSRYGLDDYLEVKYLCIGGLNR